MEAYKIHNGSLYDYTAGCYCGVLVTERVMKKLAKLQAKHLEEVKNILANNKDEVFPSMWTLHNPDGVHTTVRFIEAEESVDLAISRAVIGASPKHHPLVFYASSMAEAAAMADAHYAAHKQDNAA